MDHRPPKPASPGSEPKRGSNQDGHRKGSQEAVDHEPEVAQNPPLPDEDAPPLPTEAPPLPEEALSTQQPDDGWEPMWDVRAQAFYFYNRITQASQWENPRVPEATQPVSTETTHTDGAQDDSAPTATYNPAIHGDYDPTADYAKPTQPTQADSAQLAPGTNPADAYAATGAFNRFTGKWQNADFTPERFSDESKSKRQMNAFFDVDAAANSHDGRSLRQERQQKKLSKTELKQFKEKRREKKEEKRRAWLKD